jgi:hypothetical protein
VINRRLIWFWRLARLINEAAWPSRERDSGNSLDLFL